MRVHINEPRFLDELGGALREAGCVSVPVSSNAISVVHPFALDQREETIELTFFLRAWAAARPEAQLELAS